VRTVPPSFGARFRTAIRSKPCNALMAATLDDDYSRTVRAAPSSRLFHAQNDTATTTDRPFRRCGPRLRAAAAWPTARCTSELTPSELPLGIVIRLERLSGCGSVAPLTPAYRAMLSGYTPMAFVLRQVAGPDLWPTAQRHLLERKVRVSTTLSRRACIVERTGLHNGQRSAAGTARSDDNYGRVVLRRVVDVAVSSGRARNTVPVPLRFATDPSRVAPARGPLAADATCLSANPAASDRRSIVLAYRFRVGLHPSALPLSERFE
jgi:hypothetical protein